MYPHASTEERGTRWHTALDDAWASLRRLGIPEVLPALHAVELHISRTVLGGSHSVAVYPPLDSLAPVDASLVLNTVESGRDASLYVHIPFCETHCTYCHYAVQHYAGKGNASRADERAVERYLEALKRELALWGVRLARSGTGLSSIYIGGGTPLVLEENELRDLMHAIAGCFEILPGAEVCAEGSPLTIAAPGGADKLRFLREHGFTRLSFGVQSFDDTVLRFAARGYMRDVPIRAAQIVSGIFDNWNLDLIQGLYRGSPAEAWLNLQVIAELRPAHLTWYHARFADRPQGDWYESKDRHGGFEDEPATLLGRMLIWQGMSALGYQRTDGNRFVRDSHYADPFKIVRTSSRDLLGVGAASYSHIRAKPTADGCWGYVFRNDTRVGSYARGVLSGQPTILTGRVMDDEEMLAMSYATGLRNGRFEDSELLALAGRVPQLSEHYRDLVSRLVEIGVLERRASSDGEEGLSLTELGRLFEDETLALFFSPSVKQAMRSKWRPALQMLLRTAR